MKLVELVWQCEECGEKQRVTDPNSGYKPTGSVAVCVDFTGSSNPWITLCPNCIERLEKTWPKLVAKFREIAATRSK